MPSRDGLLLSGLSVWILLVPNSAWGRGHGKMTTTTTSAIQNLGGRLQIEMVHGIRGRGSVCIPRLW